VEFLERFYPESRFGGYSDIDGTVTFSTRVNALLEPQFTVADIGCGRGSFAEDPNATKRSLRILKGKVREVVGLDVDESARGNPYLDRFEPLRVGERWPLDDHSVDLLLSDNVVEHLDDPDAFFSELRRVVRDGGYVCLRTPNSRSYIALISRLIPNRRHARVVGWAQDGRQEQDVFPVRYRCNTVGKLRRMLDRHGIDAVVYGYEAEPSYLSMSGLLYRLGVWHQRVAPGFLRSAIFVFGRARGAGRQSPSAEREA